MTDCVFCRIVARESPADIEYESLGDRPPRRRFAWSLPRAHDACGAGSTLRRPSWCGHAALELGHSVQ